MLPKIVVALLIISQLCNGRLLSRDNQTGNRSNDDVHGSRDDDLACAAGSRPLVLTDYSGTFSSPNYPNPYPPTSNCQWLIVSQEPNGVVVVDFEFFETMPWFDFVVLYDGNTTQASVITSFDGTWNPWPVATGIRSTGRTMLMTFTSIASPRSYVGFNVTYTSSPPKSINDPCYPSSRPQFLAEYSGTLSTTGHPDKTYLNYAICDWLIESQIPNGVVEISFNSFWTEGNYDFLSIYDGNTATSSPLIASLSGFYASQPPGSYRTTQNYMFLRFTSDTSVVDIGFSINFTSIAP